MSPWIDHVKRFQAQNPQYSYKDCLSLASPSYRSQSGAGVMGKIKGAKKAVKKSSKMVAQGSQLVDQFGTPLVSMVNPDAGAKLKATNAKVKNVNGKVTQVTRVGDQVIGGRFHLGKALKKSAKVMKYAAPVVSMVSPEIGVPMYAASQIIGSGSGKYKRKTAAQNKYLQGGSFSRPGQSGGCLNTSQSSMLSHLHPSFTPIIPRSRY